MSRFKKTLSILGLSIASISILSGFGLLLSQSKTNTQITAKADTEANISNSVPEFFNAKVFSGENEQKDLIEEDSPLVFASDENLVNLSFETEKQEADGKSYFTYNKDEESWTAFSFANFSIKRNGEDITINTPAGVTTNFVERQTRDAFDQGTYTYSFNLNLKLDTSKEENAFVGDNNNSSEPIKSNTLVLNKEGIYEITIPYTMYLTDDDGKSFYETRNENLTFRFMLFKNTTYFQPGMTTPIVEVSNDLVQRTVERSNLAYKYYFYNYTSDTIPYIAYDVTKYNLKLTRDYNLSTLSEEIVYDSSNPSEFLSTYSQSELFDLKLDGTKAYVYINDLGDYTLDFDLVYRSQNGDDYLVYTLPEDVTDQKLYVYGYQSTYTKYNSSSNKNSYPEFKTIENNKVTKSADISRFVTSATYSDNQTYSSLNSIQASTELSSITLTKAITPVKTNQVPVKFKEYANIYGNGALYKATVNNNNTITLSGKTDITSSKNISEPGTYVAVFTYRFDEYLNNEGLSASNEQFTQVFFFEVDNSTPSVKVYAVDKDETSANINEESSTQLSSGAYTNKDVYIKNVYDESEFNSEVRIELEWYDFVNKTQRQTRVLSNLATDENGFYKISENGNYTLKIYYGRNQSNPIVRRFNIDNTEIEGIEALSVKSSGSNSYYTTSGTKVTELTNEPLVFAWDNVKSSGAITSAYYKFYPINQTTTFSTLEETQLSNTLARFANNNEIPVDYELKLNSQASWIYYENAKSVSNSLVIPASYVKSASGLYILDVFDEAGNKATKIYLLDTTAPNFVIYQQTNSGTGKYSFLTKSETLSRDAEIYWGEKKVLKAESLNANFKEDKNGEITTIESAWEEFESKYLKQINYLPQGNGTYLSIPIEKDIYFKNAGTSEYVKLEESEHKIVSSFKLYYTLVNGIYRYYFSTSVENEFVYIANPETALVDNESATKARIEGDIVSIYSDIHEYTSNPDGKNYNSIYNMEGSFTFLVRDESNTKFSNVSNNAEENELQTYLNYPSAYQTIQLTSDASTLQVGYTESSNFTPLTKTADYAAYETSSDGNKTKFMFYEPTSINQKLYVSFTPRIIEGDKVTQVKEVTVKYYPFITSISSLYNQNKYQSTKLNFYRDIASAPEYTHTIYSYTGGDSTDKLSFELQVVNERTSEGVYVITRTYMQNSDRTSSDTTNYYVNDYDYLTRQLTLVVDRENLISEPEVVEGKVNTYTYSYDSNSYEVNFVGSTIFSNAQFSNTGLNAKVTLENGVVVDINGNVASTSKIVGNQIYYIYQLEQNIKSLDVYYLLEEGAENEKLTPTTENPSQTTIKSTQSTTGNGILVSVFANYDDFVEFPNYEKSDLTAINKGQTFYTTKQSFVSLDSLLSTNPVFTTNKVPFKVYVPEFKYTYQTSINSNNNFSAFENERLSFFGSDENKKAILSYKLHALIYKDSKLVAQSSGAENGYLKFVDTNGNEIEGFSEEGTYAVVVIQGYNDIALGNESFKNTYTFSFNVEKQFPEFDLFSGEGKALKDDGTNLNKFYSNSNKIITTWTDNNSEYMVNIDPEKISLYFDSKTYNVNLKNKTITSESGVNFDFDDAFTYVTSDSTLDHRLEIDLAALGLNKNGSEFSITMSYKHPNGIEHYKSTTKTVCIDKTIYDITVSGTSTNFSSTIDELFAKIRNIDYTLSLDSIRNFYSVDGLVTTDKTITSFSTSASTGFYRNYTYPVDKAFFESLLEKTTTNSISNKTGVTSIYFRSDLFDIYDKESNFEETDYRNFFETNSTTFTKLSDVSINEIVEGNYYEIIETDYAGNLLIYLVYVKKSNEDALTFIDKTETQVSSEEIATNRYNIFGSTDLKIESISLYGDKWNFVQVQNNGITTSYALSPYLDDYQIKNLSTQEIVDVRTILNQTSTVNKSLILISDRSQNETYTVYSNRSNLTSIQAEKLTVDEGIRIALPSGNVVTDRLIKSYPVKIRIESKPSGSNSSYNLVVEHENNPNKNLLANYSYQTSWNNVTDSDPIKLVSFVYTPETGYLNVKFLTLPETNTKVKYTIWDNFGNETSVIQIVGTDFADGEEYTGNLYKSFDETGELYNRTENSYTYIYNPQIYTVHVYKNGSLLRESEYSANNITFNSGTRNSLTFSTLNKQIDQKFEIKVYDEESGVEKDAPNNIDTVKNVYVHLYKMLPSLNDDDLSKVLFIDENANNLNDRFTATGRTTINEKTYNYTFATTFASVVNIRYDSQELQFPYSAYIFKEGESEDFEEFEKRYKIEQSGVYYILFKYNSNEAFTNEYVMYRIEILDSSTTFFYVTVDGNVVNAQGNYYTAPNKKQYSNYYSVNVPYSEKSRVVIETNQYQKVKLITNPSPDVYTSSSNVTTVVYTLSNLDENTTGISPFKDNVAISYIPVTRKPAQEISYVSETGDQVSLIDVANTIIASQLESSFDKLKIRWSSYYGITENKINLSVEKDGYNYQVPIYSEDEKYNYTYLTISGNYKLTFTDNSGNAQTFAGRDYMSLTFLKDVHFTMIYKDQNGNNIQSEAIEKGVFNDSLSLKIMNISSYYASSSVGTGLNMIHVKRNGVEYQGYTYNANESTFNFNEVGYYEVYFSATTANGIQIRQQTYTFTILNANESRYAYEFAPYAGYTIEKVVKDNGVSIVETTSFTGEDLYSLYVSEEKDGSARWTVTINTNKVLTPGSNQTTSFTFSFLTRSAVPPIDVSIKEGETTTKAITVSFNATNIYNSVGDCVLTVANKTYEINSDTIAELGVVNLTITDAGTYLIQVHTVSGNLLYSYKVTKKDPLNGWAIAAIAIGSVVLIASGIIVFKLRKRIKSK